MVGTSGQATAPFNDRNVSLEALAESEQRSRTLVEALPDAILVHSEDKIVFVNPFCVRLLGAAGPEQLLGKDINEIVNPDDLPAIRNRIQDCYASGTASPPMESVLIACDGSSVEIEAVAIPICWNGAPAIEVVARDIRERKRAERAVQDWQEALGIGTEGRSSDWTVGLGRSGQHGDLVGRDLPPVRIHAGYIFRSG